MMYKDVITTHEEALTHLFFHCCFKDDTFNDDELKAIADKLVMVDLHTHLNFKEEVVKYRSYRPQLEDEQAYLNYLVQLIRPTNELALYSYCVELCLGDAILGATEERLLKQLAHLFEIEADAEAINKLMIQRKVVETQKLF